MSFKVISRTLLVFLLAYVLFLVLWIQVKDPYGQGITRMASEIVSVFKDVELKEIVSEGDGVRATFVPLRHKARMLIDVNVLTSTFTFNAPLTFSLMACLYPFIRRRPRAYAEALLMLVLVHLTYVVAFEAKELTEIFANLGFGSTGKVGNFLYQFFWSFTDNMVIRFEPFLIGLYMYIRFRKG